MSYKGLKLNTNLINKALEGATGKKLEPKDRKNGDCLIHRYELDNNSILDIYYNSNSTTSLVPIGRNATYASLVADEIVELCEVNLPNPTRALYLKDFDQSKLTDIINVLIENECVVEELVSTNISIKYKVTNNLEENIKIHFYPTTGAINFQGKGFAIYSIILTFLDDTISLEEAIESSLSVSNIENIDSLQLKRSMQRAFVSSFDYLKGPIANIMASSFFLTKIENSNLPDYSWMINPILRGFEGFIKKLLMYKGIRINRNFGEVFEPISQGSTTYRFIPIKIIQNSLSSDYVATLERCYNFYNANRHGLSHMGVILNTTRILDRSQAVEIFNETIELVETSFNELFIL